MSKLRFYKKGELLYSRKENRLTKGIDARKLSLSPVLPRRARVMAYIASIWAFLFAALSFFWAAGGRTGLHPFELIGMDDPVLYATNLIAGFLKVAAGLVIFHAGSCSCLPG